MQTATIEWHHVDDVMPLDDKVVLVITVYEDQPHRRTIDFGFHYDDEWFAGRQDDIVKVSHWAFIHPLFPIVE